MNAVSRADVSTPMPDISDALKGKWPVDATDVGLTGISDIDDIPLLGAIAGAISAALLSITMLENSRESKLMSISLILRIYSVSQYNSSRSYTHKYLSQYKTLEHIHLTLHDFFVKMEGEFIDKRTSISYLLKRNTHSFPEFIRIGWKFAGAGSPLTPCGLDIPQPIESI